MTYNAATMLDELFEPMDSALSDDWLFAYEERAAIMEYCGGMSRQQAEDKAVKDIQRQMKEKQQIYCALG